MQSLKHIPAESLAFLQAFGALNSNAQIFAETSLKEGRRQVVGANRLREKWKASCCLALLVSICQSPKKKVTQEPLIAWLIFPVLNHSDTSEKE